MTASIISNETDINNNDQKGENDTVSVIESQPEGPIEDNHTRYESNQEVVTEPTFPTSVTTSKTQATGEGIPISVASMLY